MCDILDDHVCFLALCAGRGNQTEEAQKKQQTGTTGQTENNSRWWFEIFFIFTPTWGRFPF